VSLAEALTPTQYSLNSVRLRRESGDVKATFNLTIHNEAGDPLTSHQATTTLTANEKQVLAAFVERELGAFESATGLAEYTGPEMGR